jgi:hypothetical protein
VSKVYDFNQYKKERDSVTNNHSDEADKGCENNIIDLNQYCCDKYRSDIVALHLDNIIANIFSSNGSYDIELEDSVSIPLFMNLFLKVRNDSPHISEVKKSTCEYCGFKYYGSSYLCKECEQSLEIY